MAELEFMESGKLLSKCTHQEEFSLSQNQLYPERCLPSPQKNSVYNDS